MTIFDEDAPKAIKQIIIGENIEAYPLTELNSRIEALKSEIVRVEQMIIQKSKYLSAAENIFAKK